MAGSLVTQEVASEPRAVSLADRYEKERGTVFMSGIQALVRVLLDQHRADRAAGLRTATLASGYQGSPLAGFDRELARLGELAAAHQIVMRPALNEELGATAVWGSQLAGTLPRPRHDGVVGVWYGKAPGLDRATDAIRHGNHVGTDPDGGVLALVGDDPGCKSSTIPSASEPLLASLQIPTFVPGSIQEALDLGLHAIACSRASGLWSALRMVTNVADAAGTVDVGPERVMPQIPELEWEGRPYVHRPSASLLPPESLEMERTITGVRLELARLYARTNGLNRIHSGAPDARLGVIASGVTHHEVRRALAELGLGEDDAPVRLLQLGMVFPLDTDTVRDFARGLEEVVVVEEKGPFLEGLVKDTLYGMASQPLVVGKRDEEGRPLLAAHGALDADSIARALGPRLTARHELPGVRARLDELSELERRPGAALGARRTPFFCSGCPHNTGAVADDDEIVGAGIGCHTMIMLQPERHGDVRGNTQMGGEGAQWIGAAPFVDVGHFTQNLGDGTFHHSGSLAIRAAVAAGLDITYKLLFNGTVAMTGGQDVQGEMPVEAVARSLAAEGVARIIITTEDPDRYEGVSLPEIAEVRDRGRIRRAQRELADTKGVTVLLHDQACAAELRRARKRGKLPEPAKRVVINERVCEGCGDCGEKSGCLSVEPVETEFGRKTRINQTSCNKDYSCLEGDCPSFVTLIEREGAGSQGEAAPRLPDIELPEPQPNPSSHTRIRLFGIGGTGVVTVSQVLGMAALLDGRHVNGLDQTGLSQKAGPVLSDLEIAARPLEGGASVPAGSADVILGLDLLGATSQNLRVADPARTVAVVSQSVVPTGAMTIDVNAASPDVEGAREAIDSVTRAHENAYLDAQRIAEELLGDATQANVVVLGAALEKGLLPVSAQALEEAFRLNGVAVERNLAALAWGRAAVAAPESLAAALEGRRPPKELDPRARSLVDEHLGELDPELRRVIEVRADDLIGWGGARVARQYVRSLAALAGRSELERAEGADRLLDRVARGLHKLLAYKDEYEVARLHLEGLDSLPDGARIRFHLQPPLMKAFGLRRKIALGSWFVPAFRLLRRMRRLRGTPLDPFGYAKVRRTERQLPAEYMGVVERVLARSAPGELDLAVEAAELPELIRGYEQIKLDGVRRFRERAAELESRLGAADERKEKEVSVQ